MIRKSFIFIGFFLAIFLCSPISAQKKSVHWMTFEQLEDSLAANRSSTKQKKIFIEFYTDWCTYCRKMDKVVFTKPEIVDLLNEDYYAVRFDAETTKSILFEGKTYINDQVGKSRNPTHQIAQLLASKEGQFTPPALIVLDSDFNVSARYFEYMESKRLIRALQF